MTEKSNYFYEKRYHMFIEKNFETFLFFYFLFFDSSSYLRFFFLFFAFAGEEKKFFLFYHTITAAVLCSAVPHNYLLNMFGEANKKQLFSFLSFFFAPFFFSLSDVAILFFFSPPVPSSINL